MINVTNGTNVHMRLSTFKFSFSHCCIIPLYLLLHRLKRLQREAEASGRASRTLTHWHAVFMTTVRLF
jgi:hypothetical protein